MDIIGVRVPTHNLRDFPCFLLVCPLNMVSPPRGPLYQIQFVAVLIIFRRKITTHKFDIVFSIILRGFLTNYLCKYFFISLLYVFTVHCPLLFVFVCCAVCCYWSWLLPEHVSKQELNWIELNWIGVESNRITWNSFKNLVVVDKVALSQFACEYFGFSLSVSLYQCSIRILYLTAVDVMWFYPLTTLLNKEQKTKLSDIDNEEVVVFLWVVVCRTIKFLHSLHLLVRPQTILRTSVLSIHTFALRLSF
jgi:hypothetical protein